MILLQKVFKLRDDANPDMEKPFLEHLEDLRVMITKIVLTLIIAMVACFALQRHVMDVLRKPVEDVWGVHMQATLPKEIEIADWEAAKQILDRAVFVADEERDDYLGQFDQETQQLVRAAQILRLTKGLPEEKQDDYVKIRVGNDEPLAALIGTLRESKAEPDSIPGADLTMMSALKPTETFMLSMKLSFFAGIVVSFPFLLYFTLQFVLPGLHTAERKILWPSMAIGFGLFLLGVFFAYFVVLPRALVFFFEWDQGLGVASEWRIGWYIGFAAQFTLLFGLSFELPVVVMALVKLGLLSYETMSRTRRYAILAIVVLAAVITPTGDVLTLSMMAVPMYILYEACIWLAWFDNKKKAEEEEEEEKERMERLLENPDEADTEDLDPHTDESGEEEDYGDDYGNDLEDHYDHGDYEDDHYIEPHYPGEPENTDTPSNDETKPSSEEPKNDSDDDKSDGPEEEKHREGE